MNCSLSGLRSGAVDLSSSIKEPGSPVGLYIVLRISIISHSVSFLVIGLLVLCSVHADVGSHGRYTSCGFGHDIVLF